MDKPTSENDLVRSDFNLRKCFEGLRFDEKTHLGLGDIRLTIGLQDEICDLVERFYAQSKDAEIAELRKELQDFKTSDGRGWKATLKELLKRAKPFLESDRLYSVDVAELLADITKELTSSMTCLDIELARTVMKTCDCPVCKGTGKFELPRQMEADSSEIKQRIIVELRAKGYSVRQIMRAMGYKSPRSIAYVLAKSEKNAKVL